MVDASYIDYESVGLYIPPLDRRDEETLFQESRLEVFNRSRGRLNNFNEGSNVSSLLRGFVFAASELQKRNQDVLAALALKSLATTGYKRQLGQKAIIQIEFRLTTFLSYAFVVERNTELVDDTGALKFYTINQLEIPANNQVGYVNAIAENTGSRYNVEPFTINRLTSPLAFVSQVTNPNDRVQDGLNEESIEDALFRSAQETRTQTLASMRSYEEALEALIGVGSRAKAIYGLNATKTGFNRGTIHLFGLRTNGDPISEPEAVNLYANLITRVQLGTQLHVSPMELLLCEGYLIAKLKKDINPTNAFDILWQAYKAYFKTLTPGSTIITSNIEYYLLDTKLLDYIEDFRLSNNIDKIPMANEWILGSPYNLEMDLISQTGQLYNDTKGNLEPLDYDPE